MSKVPTTPPSGFRDFLPREAATRLELVDTITRVYRSHGFLPIGMPLLENLSTLQGKGGGSDNEKLIFKVLKRGEELERSRAAGAELADLGLRFDLTLPLARYCARFREQLPRPFKVFQIGPVWRADRPQKGRFREFFQCDVDIVGAREIGAELDCISAILGVFEAVGLQGIELHLNDRRLLNRFAERLGVAESGRPAFFVALDKLDKIGAEGVLAELSAQGLLAGDALAGLRARLAAPASERPSPEWLELEPESAGGLAELCGLLRLSTGYRVVFNPTLVRGQDYYTGTIFELRHAELSGSLGGGGRYNRLLEVFGSPETPAFGGSIGFERLFLLLEAHHAGARVLGPEIFFPLFDAKLRSEVHGIAVALRRAGLLVDVYPDAGTKFGKQLAHAEALGVPYTLILGEAELSRREVKLKDMQARSERTLSCADLPKFCLEMRELCRKPR